MHLLDSPGFTPPLVSPPIHKLHHKYKDNAVHAYAFHPLMAGYRDARTIFLSSSSRHHLSYFIALGIVGLWTINISTTSGR